MAEAKGTVDISRVQNGNGWFGKSSKVLEEMQRCGSEEMVELANLWPAFIIYHSASLPAKTNHIWTVVHCHKTIDLSLPFAHYLWFLGGPALPVSELSGCFGPCSHQGTRRQAHSLLCWLWNSWPLPRVWPGSYNIKWLLELLLEFIIVSNLVLVWCFL